jgi:hypothetical protein
VVLVAVPVCEAEVLDAEPADPPLELVSETGVAELDTEVVELDTEVVEPETEVAGLETRALLVILDELDDREFDPPVDVVAEEETEEEEEVEEVAFSASPIIW